MGTGVRVLVCAWLSTTSQWRTNKQRGKTLNTDGKHKGVPHTA